MKFTTDMRPRVALSLLCASTALALCACSKPAPQAMATPTALVVQASTSNTHSPQAYPGEIQARYETPLAFRLGGKLAARYVHLGDAVRQGQVLAELDSQDAQAQLTAAKAQLGAASARQTQTNAAAQRSTAQSREALISASENEQSQASAQVAMADVQLASSQAELAQHQLQYTRLVAEHDGIITSEDAEAGAVVAAGQKVFGLAWSQQTDVVIDVPESRISTIQPHAKAQVTLSGDAQQHWSAQVREIAQAANPQTRTFRVKLSLDGGATAPRLGMTVQVAFAGVATVPQVEVPSTALFHDGTFSAVWVLHAGDNKLHLRRVTVSGYGEHSVTLSAGLEPGETVLAQGVHTVSAGMVVAPRLVTDAGVEQ